MMPPPLHVCNGLASSADAACRKSLCTLKFVKSFAMRQHQFDVDSHFGRILLPRVTGIVSHKMSSDYLFV